MLPLPGRAAQMDFAAEQACQFAADGKTEAGAAIFPAGAGVGLLERLEDQLLLFQGNADAGIGHLEGDDGRRVWFRIGCSALQPPTAAETVSFTPPSAVNLKAFDSRFFSTCCRRFESVTMLRARLGSTSMLKESLRFSASCRNGRPTVSSRLDGQDFLRIHRHGAGFDLRQVEDVADQVEQVGAGAVDGAGEFDLLAPTDCRPDFR